MTRIRTTFRFTILSRLPPLVLWCLFFISLLPELVWSQEKESSPARIDPTGIRGSLVIGGGGNIPAEARDQFVKLAGGETSKIVVIPTARDDAALEKGETSLKTWDALKPASVKLLHTRSRDEANRDTFFKPLTEATAVWFDEGDASKIIDAYQGTAVERETLAVLQRGGTVGGTSTSAALLGATIIAGDEVQPELRSAFDLLPGTVIESHFIERKKKSRLPFALEKRPALFGVGIDEDTAIVVRGREIKVVGSGQLTISLAPSPHRAAREIVFNEGDETDLTRWRNAARDRTGPRFTPTHPAEPKLSAGSLVIVGGGAMPTEIIQRFIDLAGGPESTIVVLPTANPLRRGEESREGGFLTKAGCKHVVTLFATTSAEVSSPEFLKTISKAKGIWFGGGRQWRFVDAYADTPALAAFQDVLQRGGVIGGSSAGATIQGEYLVRGSPQGNTEMMAEGYERGFAFLPGTAIDQHFTQRNRQADLLSVMAAHPQLLGIGIDEATAIIVSGSTAEVLGKNEAHFYNARVLEPACISLKSGLRYDLVDRKEAKP